MKNPNGVSAFGVNLRRLRDNRKLSQQELADLSDIAKKTVQRIENGKASPTFDIQISIARGLSITVKELVDFPLPVEYKK